MLGGFLGLGSQKKCQDAAASSHQGQIRLGPEAATVWLVAKADQGPVELGNLSPNMQAPCSRATIPLYIYIYIDGLLKGQIAFDKRPLLAASWQKHTPARS